MDFQQIIFTGNAVDKAKIQKPEGKVPFADAVIASSRNQDEADFIPVRMFDKQTAIAEGDAEAAIAADREMATLQADPTPQPGTSPDQQAVVNQWIAQNQWYERDPELRDIAAGISMQLETQGVPPGPQRLAAVSKEIRGRYPDRVSSDPVIGGAPGNPEGNARPVGRSNGRTFDDLPKEAQSAYTRFKKLNPALTKPQYLAEFEWE